MGNLTILTNCKLFSGLTPTAAKCPAFPSAKRYGQLLKMKRYFLLIFIFLIAQKLFAQDISIDPKFGFGLSNCSDYLYSSSNSEIGSSKFYSIEVLMTYKPKQPIFNLNSGLEYIRTLADNNNLNLIKIPLGLQFQIGKKNQFLFGFGLYEQISMTPPTSSTYYTHDSWKLFQTGCLLNAGLNIQINHALYFAIKVEKENDLTKMFVYHYYSHFGLTSTGAFYFKSFKFNMGVKYILNRKK